MTKNTLYCELQPARFGGWWCAVRWEAEGTKRRWRPTMAQAVRAAGRAANLPGLELDGLLSGVESVEVSS